MMIFKSQCAKLKSTPFNVVISRSSLTWETVLTSSSETMCVTTTRMRGFGTMLSEVSSARDLMTETR